MQIPNGAQSLGPILHPVDDQPGTAIRMPNGVECFFDGCAIRSLPHNWRAKQPKSDALRLSVARVLTNTYAPEETE